MRRISGVVALCGCLLASGGVAPGDEIRAKLARIEAVAGRTVYSARFLPLQWENDIRRVQVLLDASPRCVGKAFSLTVTGQAEDGREANVQAVVLIERDHRQFVDFELPAPMPAYADWVVRVDGPGILPVVRRIALADEAARPILPPDRRGRRRRPPTIVPLQVRVLPVATEPVSPIEILPGQPVRLQHNPVTPPTAPQVQNPTITVPRANPVNPVNPINPVIRPTTPQPPGSHSGSYFFH